MHIIFLTLTVCIKKKKHFFQIEPSKFEGMKADDVEGALKKVLAPGYVTNLDHFVSLLAKDDSFKPYGQLIREFSVLPRKLFFFIG